MTEYFLFSKLSKGNLSTIKIIEVFFLLSTIIYILSAYNTHGYFLEPSIYF